MASSSFKNIDNFYRLLCLFSALILPVFGMMISSSFPELIDPMWIRWSLSGWLFLLLGLSYVSEFIRNHFLQLLYLTIGGVILWVNYLLFVNQLHPIYLFLGFFAIIACSLVIDDHKALKKYVLFFTFSAIITIGITDANTAHKLLSIVSIVFVSLLDFLALSKFIQSSLDLENINQNYKTLVDHVDASLFLIHRDFRIIESNQRSREKTEKIFGKSILPGYDIRKFIPEPDRERFIKTFEKVLKGENFELDQKISFSKDTPRWFQMKIIPIILEESTRAENVLLIIRNIEKEKVREESIKKNNKELLKVNAELDSFLYRSTHDLRAPLTSILGLVNVCQLEDDQSNLEDHLEMIKSSVLKLDHLIGDILDYSKNSNSEIKKSEVNFRAIIEDVFSTYSTMDFKKKIRKEIEIEDIKEFKSDPSRLKLIFNNLIANAYKYHNVDRESPFIQVKVLNAQGGIEIYVKDNGQGIETEHHEKIFDIFFRAHFKSQGSGLGLYIVKEALEKIGGQIKVSSQVQKGSEFKIYLPNLTELQPEPSLQTTIQN